MTDLTLRELQTFIAAHYHKYDSARGTGGTFLWFMEEVGELASALQKNQSLTSAEFPTTQQRDWEDLSPQEQNLREEFADVLGWLSTLANMHGVDLDEAVRRKYMKNGSPGPHKA